MARSDQFSGLSAFLAVASNRSFRAAAAELGVTRAAISQAIRALEERVGQSLVQRTTRSVTLTEAGEKLAAAVAPASAQIENALEIAASEGSVPVGHLRLSVPRIGMDLAITPLLMEFTRAFPDISVEVDVDDASVDLAAMRYDAGVRIGEFIERDMVALKLTRDFQWMVLGSPEYFARHGEPESPRLLIGHQCINYRFPSASHVYRWEFRFDGADFTIAPPGAITVNDHLSMVALAKRGIGLCYTADLVAKREIKDGELVPVLQKFLPSKQGLFLYYSASAAAQPKLRSFIDTAKRVLKAGRGPSHLSS
jgi:DNA-binding transcriptional LysR family regulator